MDTSPFHKAPPLHSRSQSTQNFLENYSPKLTSILNTWCSRWIYPSPSSTSWEYKWVLKVLYSFNVYLFVTYFALLLYLQSGPDERTIPGNTVAVQADMPFSGLTNFGGAFLSKFQCSQMSHPVSNEYMFVCHFQASSSHLANLDRHLHITAVGAHNVCRYSWCSFWREAKNSEKLWFYWGYIMVCNKMWPYSSLVWPSQTWY